MKNRHGFQMLSITLFVFVVAALAVAAQGQKPPDPKAQDPNAQVVETRPETARGEADLKTTPRVNTRDKQARQAPPHKGGEQSRGGQATCDVHFDNRTPWWIHLWVDGEYEGLMPPWGDVYTWAIAGKTRLAGRADFNNGASLTWATTVNCPAGGTYNWRLLQR